MSKDFHQNNDNYDNNQKDFELEWIGLREAMTQTYSQESTTSKMWRKVKENPLVPIGWFSSKNLLKLFY